jgi:general secretion pathway protein I
MAPDRERGFTLLEVLIAFVIAALAMGVMFDASIGGLRASQTAGRYQEAVSLARSHLAAAGAAALVAREQSGDDGRGFHWTVQVKPVASAKLAPASPPVPGAPAVEAPSVTLFALTVTESWQGDGGERQVRLDSTRLGGGAPTGG